MTVTDHDNLSKVVDPLEAAAERVGAVDDLGKLKDVSAFDELMAQIDRGGSGA